MQDKKKKHIPMRMCVGCREMAPKPSLIKIAVKEGALIIDENNKIQGRSIYVCKKAECIEAAAGKKAFNKALGAPVGNEFIGELMKYAQ